MPRPGRADSAVNPYGAEAYHYGALSRAQFAQQPGTYWHGTPNQIGGGNPAYGVHVGTHEAARQALTARIGTPFEGTWDGSREYGKTMLNRDQSSHVFDPETRTWAHEVYRQPPELPSGRASYSTGDPVPMTARPTIEPLRIAGPMTNTPSTPHGDWKANGYMAGQIKRGTARRGYFYTNVGEDEGSVSAVVPNREHLATHGDYVRAAVGGVNQAFGDHTRVPSRGPSPRFGER